MSAKFIAVFRRDGASKSALCAMTNGGFQEAIRRRSAQERSLCSGLAVLKVRSRSAASAHRRSRGSASRPFEGVRPFNTYPSLLVFILMFFVLGKTTWTHIRRAQCREALRERANIKRSDFSPSRSSRAPLTRRLLLYRHTVGTTLPRPHSREAMVPGSQRTRRSCAIKQNFLGRVDRRESGQKRSFVLLV
jgi:hypothetical protein